MKKYSKGTTLIEIIASLAMISVVLIFMFNILSDLKAEDRASTKGSKDSIERASYTRIIQNDFIKLHLAQIDKCSSSALICLTFTFREYDFAPNTYKTLEVFDNYIVYDNERWEIESTKFVKSKANFCYRSEYGGGSYIKIVIPTKLNHATSKNLDLELTYATDGRFYVNTAVLNTAITRICD